MRIPGGKVILDNTGIHPESYDTAKEILAIAGISLAELGKEQMEENKAKLAQLRPAELSCKIVSRERNHHGYLKGINAAWARYAR